MGVDTSFIKIPEFDSMELVSTGTKLTSNVAVSVGVGVYGYNFVDDVIPHNLGYIPIIIAFISYEGVYYPVPYSQFANAGSSAAVWRSFRNAVDATNITLTQELMVFGTSATDGGYTFKYYLFRPRANK